MSTEIITIQSKLYKPPYGVLGIETAPLGPPPPQAKLTIPARCPFLI